ncbi:MAG TPA: cyclopropane-fatty-acyl-phospholipid synthase family protein [Vicinamibacteria bacterium]|nr:cyclopropane-fatty-acyl-phospholipid synthase family protein [Vicinamibacteria bacterium]
MTWRLAFDWMEKDRLPDPIIRFGIRTLLKKRLNVLEAGGADAQRRRHAAFVAELKQSPIAVATDEANEQHYELPPRFFELVLGRRLKYSSAWWGAGTQSLDEAEEAMLALYEERAELRDGMDILELGCGWGSLSLWLAERFPHSRVLAVSNSEPQRRFIEKQRDTRGLRNLEIVTRDVNDFETDRKFERVVSIEMFEHMKNYRRLLERIARWLTPGGKLFVHIFSHQRFAYAFETEDKDDWMGRHFFTEGTMPSRNLLPEFDDDMAVERQWHLSGTHYAKTAEAWLSNLDRNRAEIEDVFASVYGREEVTRWIVRWRVFFMACAELWGYRDGSEWGVSHYVFVPSEARRLEIEPPAEQHAAVG